EYLNDDIRKAREFLAIAEWCFDNGHYNSCANRAYYSMFRAAFAALRKLVSPKMLPAKSSHKGLISIFTRELINRRKVFPRIFSNYLKYAADIRGQGDYRDDDVTERKARRSLKHAKEFLTKVEEVF
ncbi:TPA: HEPN domain-containing protein, partial [Candidatus Poribacteria bacterium]|nr:HEPN domain-containing protein [Candidatus Poribacteria bacterium]